MTEAIKASDSIRLKSARLLLISVQSSAASALAAGSASEASSTLRVEVKKEFCNRR